MISGILWLVWVENKLDIAGVTVQHRAKFSPSKCITISTPIISHLVFSAYITAAVAMYPSQSVSVHILCRKIILDSPPLVIPCPGAVSLVRDSSRGST